MWRSTRAEFNIWILDAARKFIPQFCQKTSEPWSRELHYTTKLRTSSRPDTVFLILKYPPDATQVAPQKTSRYNERTPVSINVHASCGPIHLSRSRVSQKVLARMLRGVPSRPTVHKEFTCNFRCGAAHSRERRRLFNKAKRDFCTIPGAWILYTTVHMVLIPIEVDRAAGKKSERASVTAGGGG